MSSLGFEAALLLLASHAYAQTYTFDPPNPQPGQPVTITATWPHGGNFVSTQGHLEVGTGGGFGGQTYTAQINVWFVQDGANFSPNPQIINASEVITGLDLKLAGSYKIAITWVADPGTGFTSTTENFTLTVGGNSSGTSFSIGPGITGNWYDPDQSGHGFSIEVLPDNQLLADWYVYGPTGGRDWIVGVGQITGNTAVLSAFQTSGGYFPPYFNKALIQAFDWGTITFTFTDCNNGTVSWQPVDSDLVSGYPAGSLPITRLTQPAGLTCP